MKKIFLLLTLILPAMLLFAAPALAAEEQRKDASLPNDIYVTDGLVLFLNAMDGYEDTVSLNENGGTWTDMYGKVAILTGSTWRVASGDGVGYRLTKSQYDGGARAGIVLDEFLPPEGYSVETVIRPVGITAEDGSRYVDIGSNFGVHLDQVFIIGPLKTLTGISLRGDSTNHSLENRWYYHARGGWHDAGCRVRIVDTALRTENASSVISYGIYHEQNYEGKLPYSVFRIYSNEDLTGRYQSTTAEFIPTSASEGRFRFMYCFPGDVYAIRVYDRPLTDVERLRNHTADIFAYYGIDPAIFSLTRTLVDDADELYTPFAEIGFDLSREEVEAHVLACVQSVYLTADGISARLDNKIGIRGVYSLNEETLSLLEAQNLRAEIGIGYALGSVNAIEDLDGVYTVFDENGKNEAFFLNERQFALSLTYERCSLDDHLQRVTFLGIYRIYDGNELLYEFSFPILSEKYDGSAFSVYRHYSLSDYQDNLFVKRTVDSFYRKEIFYVSPNGEDGGSGTEEELYATVEEAYSALLAGIDSNTIPTEYILYLMEGTHRITRPIVIEGIQSEYIRVALTADSAQTTVLTGSREIDGWDFMGVIGEDYFVYQFEKKNGSYPDFRYFFVDGEAAILASAGEKYAARGSQYATKYNRDHNNPGAAQPKFYLARELFEGVSQEELRGAELHMNGQWCFNIVRVDRVDFNDTVDGGKLVAVYVNPSDYSSMAAPNGDFRNRTYWLENSLAFLDDPGEYYYDKETGELYFYPPDGYYPEDFLLEYASLEQLIVVKDATDVTVSQITLTGLDDRHAITESHGYRGSQAGGSAPAYAAIAVQDSSYFTVQDCILRDLAADGIHLTGRLRDIKILSNEILRVGATALRLGDFSIVNFTEENSIMRLLVKDNYIDGTGWLRRESCGIMLSQAWDAKITSNTIRNCTYSAMSIGTHRGPASDSFVGDVFNNRDVEISYNYITDFVTDMRDGGAIYTLGGNAVSADHSYFNFIYRNLIVWSDFTGDIHGKAHTSGIYNDNASSNWLDSENVQLINPNRHWRGMYYHYVQADGVHDILIESNYYAGIPVTLPQGFANEYSLIYFNINNTKRIYEQNTVYCNDPWDLPWEAIDIMYMTGSSLCPPDVVALLNGDY